MNPFWKKTTRHSRFITLACMLLLVPAVSAHAAAPAQRYIQDGKEQLFSQTFEGIHAAFQTFSEAEGIYGERCTSFTPFFGDCTEQQAREKALIHGYLALSRMLHILTLDDGAQAGGGVEFLNRFGITVVGNDLESMDVDVPLSGNGYVTLPETSPTGEETRSFLMNSILGAVKDSIADMDEVIHYCGVASTYGIDTTEIISKDLMNSDTDFEVDEGDYYLFRAGLKAMKAVLLIITAYDLDMDVREVVALADQMTVNPGAFLERHPDLLTILTTSGTPSYNGAAGLAEARTTLVEAVNDYEEASELIRGDTSTTPGAQELIEIDPCDLRLEAYFRSMLTGLRTSLSDAAHPPWEFVNTIERWRIVDDAEDGFELELMLEDNLSTGFFSGTYNCQMFLCGGDVSCITLNGDQLTLELEGYGWAGEATIWGTYNPDTGSFDGQYQGYNYSGPFSGTFTGTLSGTDTETTRVNLNPLFGNGSGPYAPRDMLPLFNKCGEPRYGTMGYGLNPSDPDPTLGGILPDFATQEDWDLDYSPDGTVTIPTRTISMSDNGVNDWSGIPPVFQDLVEDEEADYPGGDIQDVYLARDATYLYVRMTLADGPPNQEVSDYEPYPAMHYFVQFRPEWEEFYDVPYLGAVYRDGSWQAVVHELHSDYQFEEHYTQAGAAQAVGNDLEWRIPLSVIGPITGRYLAAWTHWTPGWARPGDQNETCLRIGPLTTLTGTVTVPGYDGDGPVRVCVYRFDGTFTASEDNLLGCITLDQYTAGMSFTVENLPEGEVVFAAVRWDADYNGAESPGDYVSRSAPVTLAPGGTGVGDLTATTVYASTKGAPFFNWCAVHAFTRSGQETQTALTAVVVDPDGSAPNSIASFTVSGPGGFACEFQASNYEADSYFYSVSGTPQEGEYLFTITDRDGNTAVSSCYYTAGDIFQAPSDDSLNAYFSSQAPTLAWSAVSGHQGNLFYRARVYTPGGETVWTSGLTTATVVTVNSGVLEDGQDYEWRVEAFDGPSYPASNRRSVTNRVLLEVESSKPFFYYAFVYKRIQPDGTILTALEPSVGDPDGNVPGSIQTLEVRDPDGALLYTFITDDFDSPFNEYYKTLPGAPAAGIYTFTVTDMDGNTSTSYDYVNPDELPVVDSDTCRASGAALAPTLSWAAPDGMTMPCYFRAIVEDQATGNRVWSSGRQTETSVTMPGGVLQSETTYRWHVRTLDDPNMTHFSTQSRSAKKTLSIDSATPYFQWAAVYANRKTDGTFTAFSAAVFDPDGTVPDTLTTLTVTAPGGTSYDLLAQGEYSASDNEFYLEVSGPVQEGVYTFTASDGDHTVVTHDYVAAKSSMPLVDTTTVAVNGDPTGPTISWSAVRGYPGSVFYRLRVYDNSTNQLLYRSSRDPVTARTLSSGLLEPDGDYRVRIEAHDHYNWVTYNTRSTSGYAYWNVESGYGTEVSGRVTDTAGNPVQGIWVVAHGEMCGQYPVGWAETDDTGYYEMNLYYPPDQIFLAAYPGDDHPNVFYEWLDYGSGTGDCGGAAPVPVYAGVPVTGMDFILDKGPRRVDWYEASVSNSTAGFGFSVLPGYRESLTGAVVTRPDGSTCTFDLTADRTTWDSQCRYLDFWWHDFGQFTETDLGDYTLTLSFSNGAQEVLSTTLEEYSVTAVDPATITVTVHGDGSAQVNWDLPEGVYQRYQVRAGAILDGTYKEFYRSGMYEHVSSLDIPANELRCLEKGETYRWRVRAFPMGSDKWYETSYVSAIYNPDAPVNRIQWTGIEVRNGALGVDVMVEEGAVAHVTEITVTGPDDFSYTVNLSQDWWDLSTQTRIGLKGWGKSFTLTAGSYGLYIVTVTYDDGSSDVVESQLSQADVTGVDTDTLGHEIHSDGAMTFQWETPQGVDEQAYQVRIRSADGYREYYRSENLVGAINQVTASAWDLRGLTPGRSYLWFVRTYDPSFSAWEQTGKLPFLYDPFTTLKTGDFNGNETIDLADAVIALQIMAGRSPASLYEGRNLPNDRMVGTDDALYVLQRVAELR